MQKQTNGICYVEQKYIEYVNNNADENGYSKPDFIRFFILNEKNKKITSEFINSIFIKYNLEYAISDDNMAEFEKAMVHDSYLESNLFEPKYLCEIQNIQPLGSNKSINIKDVMDLQNESYQRLEYLGDSIIRSALSTYLFKRYPSENEGFLTQLRSKLENGLALANYSKILGLNKFVVISRYLEENGSRLSEVALLEDIFEAFIGALSLTNVGICFDLMTKIIEEEIDLTQLILDQTNYKEQLMGICKKRGWIFPKYTTLKTPDNGKIMSRVVCNGVLSATGQGKTTKEAEKFAAKQILISLSCLV